MTAFQRKHSTSRDSGKEVIPAGLPADKYLQVFEQAFDGIVIFDIAGRHIQANPRACEILGYGKEDLEHTRLRDLLAPTDYLGTLRSLVMLKRKRKLAWQGSIRRKNGKFVHLAVNVTFLGGDLYVGLIRDISDGLKAERTLKQSEERFRSLVEEGPHPIVLFIGGRLALTNRAARRFFPELELLESITLAEFFGKGNRELVKEFRSLLDTTTDTPEVVKREALFITSDRGTRKCEVSAARVSIEAKPCLQFTLVDITEQANILHKIEESESKYRLLIENSLEAVSLAQNDKLVFANKAFLTLFGVSSLKDIVGHDLSLILGAKDRKSALDKTKRVRDGSARRYEYRYTRKDKTRFTIEVHETTVVFDGKPASLAYHRNITERKEYETELQRKARSLELMREIALSVNHTINPDDVLAIGLTSSLKAIDFELGAAYRPKDENTLRMSFNVGCSQAMIAALETQHMLEGVTGYVAKTMEPLLLTITHYPPHLPYKGLFESDGIQTVAYVPLASQGRVNAVMMMATRKRREMREHEQMLLSSMTNQLGAAVENATLYSRAKESEELYRSAVENISDVIYHASPAGLVSFISPNIELLLGYAPHEFYNAPDLWRTLIHPDDRSLYAQRISNRTLREDVVAIEYRILPKGKAEYRFVRDAVKYRRDPHGNVLSLTGQLSDITERVQLQEAHVQSEELRTNVLESVKEGVVVYDANLVCLDWNGAMEIITGVSRADVIGMSLKNTPSQIGMDELRPLIRQALQGSVVSSEDIPLTLPGEIEARYIWARYSPLLDKGEKVQGVVGIITDVTSRRRLEHEAKESEQILRNVIDGMGDALMICDLQGKVWEVNREFSRITGFQRSKVLGMDFPYPWLVEEEMARFVTWIAALREMNELRDFDMTWRKDDGDSVAMSLNTTLLRNALGEPVAMLNIARDISDRKRLALELEKKNSQIELLNRIISKANATIDFNDIFVTISNEVLNLVSYDQINVGLLSDEGRSIIIYACYSPVGKCVQVGEVIPIENTVSKVAIAREHGIVIGHLASHEELGAHTTSIAEGFESQISIPIFVNERVLGTFNIASVNRDAYSKEELGYLQPIADQIGAMIDRVRLFQRVSDDSKYIHNLLNSINSVVYTADKSHRITEVNKAWREFAPRIGLDTYRDESSLIGTNLWDILPQPELRTSFERVMPQLFDGRLEYYSQEYEIRWNGEPRTYHVALNPMVINDKVTGLVFAHTDITDIKRTEAEIKRRNKELVALNTISTSISKSLHLNEVLSVSAEQIKEIVGADMVLFYLLNERRDKLVLSCSLGLPDQFVSTIGTLAPSTSVSGFVISQGRPMLIEEGLATNERVTPSGREIFRSLGIDSLAAIPLQSKDKVLGAMDVAFAGTHEFSTQDQQLLSLIGNQIGPAIENAVLYKEVQDQVQRITSLYMIGKGLTGALDPQTLLEVVHAEVSRAIPLERFTYATYSDQHDTLTTLFEVADGVHTYYRSPLQSPSVVQINESHYSSTVYKGEPWLGRTQDFTQKSWCVLAVPVRSKQKVVGVLSLSHSNPDVYTETHLRLLESIANLTEIALDKAMLYEDTINKSIEIQNRNKELDDFTYVVSHDLKEPLISIEGYSKILLKDYRDRIDDDGREYLGSVVQSSARMKSLIDDLLTLSRVGRTMEATESVSVGESVEEIIHDLQFTLTQKNVRIIVAPNLPHVQYNRTQLSVVFRNLISNAMKFNTRPDPRITIDFTEGPEEFVFSVADNGIGIETQYFDRIFMIFQRLQRSEEFRGTGAGLTIVKKIVENHKGRIWLDSALGQGTTFYFTIPKRASGSNLP